MSNEEVEEEMYLSLCRPRDWTVMDPSAPKHRFTVLRVLASAQKDLMFEQGVWGLPLKLNPSGSNKTPRYIFDHSIERIVFGNEVSGPAYLNSYSLSMLLDTILRPADNVSL